MPSTELSLDIYQGTQALKKLFDTWSHITMQPLRSAYYSLPEWHQAFIQNRCHSPTETVFFLYKINGEPAAIFPLTSVTESQFGLRMTNLHFTIEDYFGMLDIIVFKEAIFDYSLQDIIKLAQHKIPDKSINALILKYTVNNSNADILFKREKNRVVHYAHHETNYVNTESREVYLSRLAGKHKRNLRRHEKNIKKNGRLDFVVVTDKNQMVTEYENFVALEATGWKGQNSYQSTLAGNQAEYNFYRDVTMKLADKDKAQLNILKLNDTILAMQIAFIANETFYIAKITYNESFAKYSPGSLLMHATFKMCCDNPAITRASFITNYEWNKLWGIESVDVYYNAYYTDSFTSRFAYAICYLLQKLRHLKRLVAAN